MLLLSSIRTPLSTHPRHDYINESGTGITEENRGIKAVGTYDLLAIHTHLMRLDNFIERLNPLHLLLCDLKRITTNRCKEWILHPYRRLLMLT